MGGQRNFEEKRVGGPPCFLPLKYGGLTDFMKKVFGGPKAFLAAEVGGGRTIFGDRKNPLPGGFPGKFWSLP